MIPLVATSAILALWLGLRSRLSPLGFYLVFALAVTVSVQRVGAWASPQSEVISGRDVLVKNAAAAAARHLLSPPRPPHWGGFRLVPDTWEFWQGRFDGFAQAASGQLLNDFFREGRLP